MAPRHPAPIVPPIIGGIAAQEVSASQAALLLGRGERTIRRYVAEGTVPALRLPNGQIRIRVADLDRIGKPVVAPTPPTKHDQLKGN